MRTFFVDLKSSVKNAMLFVGTVVGAGFATGQEIALYFRGSNFYTILFSGIFISLFAFLFLTSGKIQIKNPFLVNGYKIIMLLTSIVVFGIMIAGIEELFYDYLNLRYVGLLIGILSLAITASGLDATKKVNVVLMPLLLGLIIAVVIKKGEWRVGESFYPLRGIEYASMNMLFSGELMRKSGENESKRSNILTAIIIFVVVTILLLVMQFSIQGSEEVSLPFVFVSNKLGVGGTAFVSVALAIFTTMLSCGKISQDTLKCYWKKVPVAISSGVILAVAIFVSIFGFSNLVDSVYPVTSYMGIGLCVMILCLVIHDKIKIKFAIDKKGKTAYNKVNSISEVSMKRLMKNKKGFTLVELVVVIAILAILAGVATGATIGILKNARKNTLKTDASTVVTAWQTYRTTLEDQTGSFYDYITTGDGKIDFATTADTDKTAIITDGTNIGAGSSQKTKSGTIVLGNQDWKVTITLENEGTAVMGEIGGR